MRTFWLLPTIVLTLPLAVNEAHATSYGCSIAGNWGCYPSPRKCYEYGSTPVHRFPTVAACKKRSATQGFSLPDPSSALPRSVRVQEPDTGS